MSDNPGGGGTSDSVVILQEMLDRGVTNAVVATIVENNATILAHKSTKSWLSTKRFGGVKEQF